MWSGGALTGILQPECSRMFGCAEMAERENWKVEAGDPVNR